MESKRCSIFRPRASNREQQEANRAPHNSLWFRLGFQIARQDQKIIGRLQCGFEICTVSTPGIEEAVSAPFLGFHLAFVAVLLHRRTKAGGLCKRNGFVRRAVKDDRRRQIGAHVLQRRSSSGFVTEAIIGGGEATFSAGLNNTSAFGAALIFRSSLLPSKPFTVAVAAARCPPALLPPAALRFASRPSSFAFLRTQSRADFCIGNTFQRRDVVA